MRMNPPFHQEPLDVMSTDDSGVLPGPPTSSSTDLSINTSVTSNTSPITTMKPPVTTTVVSSSQTLESNVDTASKGASQASLSSLTESNEDSRTTRFKVISVDALSLDGELGERRDHANSAFEIMSVVTDLDSSTAHTRQPTSADDSLRNISKGESGSEEDATSLSENRIDLMASSNARLSANPSTLVQENHSDPNNNGVVGNGSNVPPGPSRFKRVNMYERGRWTIKDLANTEESQKDPQKIYQEGSIVGVLSPAISRKTNPSEFSEPPLSATGDLSSGSGMLSDANSEKDGTGSIIERSSTAAESTLSRRSSMSSLLPDDHCDVESVASASGSTAGRDRDTPEVAPVPTSQQTSITSTAPVPVTATLPSQSSAVTTPLPTSTVSVTSSGVSTMAPTVVSTAQVREEPHVSGALGATHGPSCSCEACTESREKESAAPKPKEAQPLKGPGPASVKHAMSHLQSELEQLLLVNLDVDKQNSDLTEENRLLKEEVYRLKEDNTKLKNELASLKQSLAQILVNTGDSSSSDTNQPQGAS